jgi:hypothetical protein
MAVVGVATSVAGVVTSVVDIFPAAVAHLLATADMEDTAAVMGAACTAATVDTAGDTAGAAATVGAAAMAVGDGDGDGADLGLVYTLRLYPSTTTRYGPTGCLTTMRMAITSSGMAMPVSTKPLLHPPKYKAKPLRSRQI